jgi:hypothetical protein
MKLAHHSGRQSRKMVSLTFTDSQVYKLTRTEMAPYLQLINSDRSDLINKLLEKNKAHLEEIDTKLKEAITNEGDSEISEQLRARAMYFCRIGDKVRQQMTFSS